MFSDFVVERESLGVIWDMGLDSAAVELTLFYI